MRGKHTVYYRSLKLKYLPVMTHTVLNNGLKMPLVGLGTFKIKGSELVRATLETAIAVGYRAIDTAGVYKNEQDIGQSLKEILPKHSLTRSDIFITSKLGPKDHGKEKCRAACLKSINDLQCDYLDLYLIHWPGGQGRPPGDSGHKDLRQGSWLAMEELYKEGKIKAIGVSNYLVRHMEELLTYSKVRPAVLQVEYHPHLVSMATVDFCRQADVFFQAYSSLGTSDAENKLICDENVLEIADRLCRTPAQILLRWAVQQKIGVIPKSTNKKHLEENLDIFSFELSDKDMTRLTCLDRNQHYCWDPQCVL